MSTARASDTIEQLTAIWSRILQTAPIDPDSNFFDLGGDSLLAVNLFLEIERATGRNFAITTIYDAPTIAEMAALMEEEHAPNYAPLVQIKDGSATPFFIVHGIGGSVVEFAPLGKLIRADNPVYAIQARGLDGAEPPIASVEDMADCYVDAIRQKQPQGPYFLGGYSFGGLVAMEIARRLKQAGERIDLLLLIDAYAHPHSWPLLPRVLVRARRLVNRLRQFARMPLADSASFVIGKAKKIFRRGTVRATAASMQAKRSQNWLGEIDPSLPTPLKRVRYAGDAALLSYTPQSYPGKIVFLKAARTGPVFPLFPRTIWAPLTDELDLRTVAGDHRSIIHEDIAGTAETISACLASQSQRAVSASVQRKPTAIGTFPLPARSYP